MNRKNEFIIFFMALAMIGVTFGGGIIYLKTESITQAALSADIANAVAPIVATTTPIATTTVVAATTTKANVTTKPTPAVSTTPTSTPKVVVIQTPPPAPKPVPPPLTKPTPAPVVVTPTPATTTKSLPYSITTFAKSQGWKNWWGNFKVATDSLTMGASTDGTSGGVFLDGTSGWGNYDFNATVNWVSGQTFALEGWYVDQDNFVQCQYIQDDGGVIEIQLQQYINGNEYTLASGEDDNFRNEDPSNINVSISLNLTQGTCTFGPHSVSNIAGGDGVISINPPFAGEIGFNTWDPDINNSEIIVKKISVTPLQ
jgi:hypothetical protein